MRECFAPGKISINYGRIGTFNSRDELIAVFDQLACAEDIVETHHAQNPRVDLLSSTQAQGVFGLYYFMIDTSQNKVTQLGGYYEDEYKKLDGHWKITASTFIVTSTQIMDVGDGLAKILFASKSAPLEIDDPSRQAF